MVESVQNLGENKVHSEERSEDDDDGEEDEWQFVVCARVTEVIHNVGPALESAYLEHRVQRLKEVVKARDAVRNDPGVACAIEVNWC